MSPSRRRATARCAAWHPAPPFRAARAPSPCLLVRPVVVHAARAAWRCAPFSGALEVTERRALRGYRGRTETPPAKLSAYATCHAYGTLPTHGAPGGAMVGRRASRLALYRHAHGACRTRIAHAIFARGVLPRHCPWRLATAATASWRAVFWRIPGWNRMRGGCRLRNGDCGACIRVGQRKQNRHSTSSNIRREESSEAPFPS